MSEFDALIKSYDYALDNNIVDVLNSNGSRLLPLYHTTLYSNGKNILNVRLRKDSSLFMVDFLEEKLSNPKDKKSTRRHSIIFPVTADSISRSGSSYRPHALTDSVKNIFDSDGKIQELYLKNLENWISFEKDEEVLNFLGIIKSFLLREDVIEDIGKSLFNESYVSKSGYEIFYRQKDDIKSLNLKDVFLDFIIVDFINEKDYSVTDFNKLHSSYINFTESSKEINGICNMTGEEDEIILRKHRGVIGNSKIFGLSNNQEVYAGRFKDKTGTTDIGRKSSEKILLTIKYLIDNPNSRVRLSENTYLLTWFSEDLENRNKINLTYQNNIVDVDADDDDDGEEIKRELADQFTKMTSESFRLGRMNYNEDDSFYMMIVTKVSDGRTTLDYFKELRVSQLHQNLEKWEKNYSWYRFDENRSEYILHTPSIYRIIQAAYGVERKENGKSTLVVEPKSFLSSQQQNIIMSIIEGRKLPSNITKSIELNIRNRIKYKDTWPSILFVSQAILKNKEGGNYNRMLDEKNYDRSYLFGRLLSIYENLERAAMSSEEIRTTNAEKFWNTYVNKPATTMNVLDSKTIVYLEKLKKENYGLYVKYKKAKESIITDLAENYDINSSEINKPLDYRFIFGYTAQTQKLFESTKKTEEQNSNETNNKGE